MRRPPKINLDAIDDDSLRGEFDKLVRVIDALYEEIADLRKKAGTD